MATEIGKEIPNFAQIEHMHANEPDMFLKTVQQFVSMQNGVTKNRKEMTKTVNFLGQGKLVCMALKDFLEALESKNTTAADFREYFIDRFGGKIPGAGLTLARVFGVHCLAPETSARYVPESVYDGHLCRVLQAAGKIANTARAIEGETPETSGLNHQVFTDVANLLKTFRRDALAELYEIHNRLVKLPKTDGEDKRQVLVYLTKAQLAARREREAAFDPLS